MTADTKDAMPVVGPRCEVITNMPPVGMPDVVKYCEKPTTHWYPTMGGGTMALCHGHAQKHLPHAAWPLGTLPPYEFRTHRREAKP